MTVSAYPGVSFKFQGGNFFVGSTTPVGQVGDIWSDTTSGSVLKQCTAAPSTWEAVEGGAGSFTTLTASGLVTFTNNTASTTPSTGALVVTGGVGIGGALNVGGATALNGGVTLGDVAGDALTINSSAVSIPNSLAFNTSTLVLDVAGRVLLGDTLANWNATSGTFPSSSTMAVKTLGAIVREGGASTLALVRINGTLASPTAILSGEELGRASFRGWDGAANNEGGIVQAVASENWSGSARGTRLRFFTVANGSTTTSIRAVIEPNGNYLIGTTTDDGVNLLQVAGGVALTGALTLGNAAVAETPTPTHTITIKDSTGTTYRVPCVV